MRVFVFVGRRLLLLALVMAIVSVLIFGIVQILPGDVAVMILGTSATPADLASLRQKLGLDRPAALRYADWVGDAIRGEWGTSLLYQVPVRPLVLERLGKSAVLALVALAVAVPLAIALGVLSALRRNHFLAPAVGLVTLVAINVGFLIGGIVVVETVFAYPGLGRLMVDAVNHRDVPVIQMAALVIALTYALANLAADVVYAYLDPRIRY